MRQNNYLIQASQAKKRFLTYDQQKLIAKFDLDYNDNYIYVNLLCQQYRVSKTTGDMEKQHHGTWVDGNSYEEVMTLLDLLCDSREDRFASGRWVSAQTLGKMFHRELLEQADPLALRIHREPEAFRKACLAMNGHALSGADLGYSIEFFDDLRIGLQFWFGDDEFPPKLHIMWDENTLQYLRYETTWFATSLLRRRVTELMGAGK